MNPEIKAALTTFFGDIWHIFTQVEIPYMNITFAQLYIGLFCASVFIAFIHKTLDSEVNYRSCKGDYITEGDKEVD